MRRSIFMLVLALCSAAALNVMAQSRLPKLEPLPEPPPPPPGVLDPSTEPQVTIVKKGDDRIEEYRIAGKLYMMKVTPGGTGRPYYLIDNTGNGSWVQQDPGKGNFRVPTWVIGTF